ncbi:MAG: SRPBCC family protein [Deltaproteobacteria bacterium]
MLKKIAIGVVVLVVALLGYAATRPDSFRVERSTSINAPPEKIFALINDLHRWGDWSPFEKKDPAMKRTLSGAPNGKGAMYEWDGNKKIGKGRMEITDASPPSRVTIKLDFVKPFEAHNVVDFTLEPRGDATNVTWTIQGPSPFISKVIGIFCNMDKMIGKDFETGLASLKTEAEKGA